MNDTTLRFFFLIFILYNREKVYETINPPLWKHNLDICMQNITMQII